MSDFGSVRPTKRCLSDLGVKPPFLTEPLHEIDDPIVQAAQSTPESKAAGGALRIHGLSDRVWLKCKTSNLRAVTTELAESEVPVDLADAKPHGRWWIGAAGARQDGSHHDFYAAIEREVKAGANTVSSTHLLPQEWDAKRLVAELAVAWHRELQNMVLGLIAMSLRTGRVAIAEYAQHRIKALVRAEDGHEAYLAIVAEGVPDPRVFALILKSVPGVDGDDWQPEPDSVAGLTPKSGQVIWSTLFSAEVACDVLEIAPQLEP